MAVTKRKVLGIGGATLVAVSIGLGANNLSTPTPPIPVGHGICVNGKTDQPVTYQGKAYKKGAACTVVVEPKKAPKRR